MKVDAHTIDEFFAAAGAREGDLRALDTLIRDTSGLAPKLFDGMKVTMLAYGMYHYKYASGREGDWPVIGLANQKHYISLYICAIKDGHYLPERYGDKLGRVDNGKSCIRFKSVADLNLDEVKKIIREAAEWQQAQNTPTVTN